ncbi:MAG: hypothetical protein IKC26_01800 [Clostridia bacterium]|nr:hypothetical protein [Clostridia bacterium]
MKDYISSRKYFTQKSPMPYHVIFVCAIAIGAFLVCMGPWMYSIAFPILIVAVIMEVTVCQRHVSDKYYDSFLTEERKRFISEFEEKYRRVDERALHPHVTLSSALKEKHGKPVYGGEYRFLPSDFADLDIEPLIRRGDDSVARSSVYCFTAFQLDKHHICLSKKSIGMIDDRAKTEHAAIPYTELSSVILETTPLSVGIPSAHCIELVFLDNEEKECFRLPVHGSFSDDACVERINEMIRIAKKAEATP